jgi:hypothetical protein
MIVAAGLPASHPRLLGWRHVGKTLSSVKYPQTHL